MASSTDLVLLALGLLAAVYFLKDSLFPKKAEAIDAFANGKAGNVAAAGAGSRDFVAKMKETKKRVAIFYGSQTGTAEEYATRIAKELKHRFGISSLVCDPEDYDFENLDTVPKDSAVIFVMATYGEGEPTDNAVQLMEFLGDESPAFTNGGDLSNLKYVVFALGNRTYEHYNEIGRKVDKRLSELGAQRIGERGEGDDDKSMEEDYLAWKDGMFEAFSQTLGVDEGGVGDSPDFKVTELDSHPAEKVYLGELSARALLGTKGIHDQKNPYAAPIAVARELFTVGKERNCIHVEFDIEGSGITYQHGDHLGLWPVNAEIEVERILAALDLADKRDTVIQIESLDPALAKVPFPTPTTYETIFRHYLDISAVASRQTLASFARFAPTDTARELLTQLGSDKEKYHSAVADGCLKLAEVLQLAAGDDLSSTKATAWLIPFDAIVSSVPRLQPRFYSISSSPKIHPNSIHITAVVLKYQSVAQNPKWVFGLATNYVLNLKKSADGEEVPLSGQPGAGVPAAINEPEYAIKGPRGAYTREGKFRAPVHVRRSNFRLPTSPKIPVIMIGPGTGVAPFRGFVQERVALARRAVEKNGPDALKDWAPIYLFYGCRREDEDFLYKDEWPEYEKELGGKLQMRVAFSRAGPQKVYVQHKVTEEREAIADALLNQRGYVYICGDAASMAKDVENILQQMLGEGKGGTAEKEGAAELKMLKERGRLALDVWS